MPISNVLLPAEEIAEFCRKNRIRRLALFGSVLRDDFGPDSDIDVLVEFESGHRLGYAFFGLQDELSRLLGHKVDLNTREDLSRYFRDQVVRTAEPIYEAEAIGAA
jgi:predicted nucleotidyltransferase